MRARSLQIQSRLLQLSARTRSNQLLKDSHDYQRQYHTAWQPSQQGLTLRDPASAVYTQIRVRRPSIHIIRPCRRWLVTVWLIVDRRIRVLAEESPWQNVCSDANDYSSKGRQNRISRLNYPRSPQKKPLVSPRITRYPDCKPSKAAAA